LLISQYINSSKGFVFSTDATIAVIIFLLSVSLVSVSFNSFSSTDFALSSLIDSSVNSIYKSGFLIELIEENPPENSAE